MICFVQWPREKYDNDLLWLLVRFRILGRCPLTSKSVDIALIVLMLIIYLPALTLWLPYMLRLPYMLLGK
jgi:hypothetical protein